MYTLVKNTYWIYDFIINCDTLIITQLEAESEYFGLRKANSAGDMIYQCNYQSNFAYHPIFPPFT